MEKINKFTKTLIRRGLIYFIILLFCSYGSIFAKAVLAEEINIASDAQVENSINQTSDTGNNAIVNPTPAPSPEVVTQSQVETSPTPTPTPSPQPESTPDPSPTPLPSPDTGITNNAEVENNVTSTADSGNNSISDPQPTATPDPETTTPAVLDTVEASGSGSLTGNTEATGSGNLTNDINTGDAVSVVEAENNINSTEVNSTVNNQTFNIFFSGDINLSVIPYIISDGIFAEENQNLQTINVAVLNNQNYTYLSNDVVSLANTGANLIQGGGQATINTGDAYSVVSIINKVNTTITDSTIHFVTINIFGKLAGNIILPELTENGGCCGQISLIDNQATVENNVASSALSGQNEITTTGTGSIETGNSKSTVNVINFVNTNIVDMLFRYLFINTFGSWNGDFLGWTDILATDGGNNLTLTSLENGGSNNGCSSCATLVNNYNQAYVANNIQSTASTGGNSINDTNANIKTGNAYSAVSLLNFINTNIVRSVGFFGFINIFGELDGDIGDQDKFQITEDVQESQPEENTITSQSENNNENNGSQDREQGGKLEVNRFSNDVDEYVLPGDTITFSVSVKNPGTGKVYGAKARISFIKDGVDLGGATFNLGDIEAGKSIRLTTGLVLSKNIKPSSYIARVKVWGETGPDNQLTEDYKDSTFLVAGVSTVLSEPQGDILGLIKEANAASDLTGGMISQKGWTTENKVKLFLLLCVLTYLSTKSIQERKRFAFLITQNKVQIRTKLASFRSYFWFW